MSTCTVCGKSKETPKTIKMYTAQELGETREKSGFKQVTVTTRYGDFQEHRYPVCKACWKRWNTWIPLSVYLLSAVILYFVIGGGSFVTTFWTEMAYAGGALFIAFLPLVLIVGLMGPDARFRKKALAERKESYPSAEFKVYNEPEYEKLQKTQG